VNDALERARLAYERVGRGDIISTRRGEEPRYATVTELAGGLEQVARRRVIHSETRISLPIGTWLSLPIRVRIGIAMSISFRTHLPSNTS
jgi:hypothetical protein